MIRAITIFTLLFAVAFADTKQAYMCGVPITVDSTFPAVPQILGNDVSAFNFLSFGDFYAVSGDVQGAAAIRNNLNLPYGQYSFGYELITGGGAPLDAYMKYSLVVGHDATYPSGAIYEDGTGFPYQGARQYGYIGGDLTATGNLDQSQFETKKGSLDAVFDNAQDYYTKLGQAFAALPTTITAQYMYSGLTVTCPDNSAATWVVAVSSDDMKKATYWTKTGCNDKASFVFNVGGTSEVQFHGAAFDHKAENVVWNIVGSRTVRVEIGVNGNLLAPNCVYNQPGMGVWIGLAVVGTAQQVLQINRVNCPKPVTPVSPNPCVSWESECAGLAFNLGHEDDSFFQYNAIVFGDYSANTGDIEGRVAAAGNITLGCGYSVGATLNTVNDLNTPHQYYSLIAGGSLEWCSGSLSPNTQGAVIERAYVHGSSAVPSDIVSRVDANQADISSVFAAAQVCYDSYSSQLCAGTDNAVKTIQYSGLFVTCADATADTYYISLTSADFAATTYTVTDNCNFQARWVINVRGNDNVDISGDSWPAPVGAAVYNFCPSAGRTITIHDTNLNGHLLAPEATVVQTSLITGKVVAGSISSLQINSMTTCFGSTPITLPVVASSNAAVKAKKVSVLAVSSLRVGDVTSVGTITAINGDEITLDTPLESAVYAGTRFATVNVASNAGRGQVANMPDEESSNAVMVGVATAAIAAAALMI